MSARSRQPVDDHDDSRTITITETPDTPLLSVLFGYGPMLPLAAGAAAIWFLPKASAATVESLTVLWAVSILLFLAGVRRGLSFRTAVGPTVAQIATMLALFCLAFAALTAFVFGKPTVSVVLLLAGVTTVFFADPAAARRGEAPLFFARLRPRQVPIAIVSLGVLLVHRLIG